MIDPNNVTTIRVGELPTEVFSLTDMIPHEVGTDLKKGTLNDLAIFISAFIGSSEGVGFRAVSVTDGQTLPSTTKEEFILVGKGTYYNVLGGSTLILTEELNAIVSNGSYWFIGVEIPINFEFTGITQEIREGFLDTTPSEDAVFKALALKGNIGDFEEITNKISTISNYSEILYPNEKATHDALDTKLNISDLPSNLTLYATNVPSGISTYTKWVSTLNDPDYNTTAVNISTGQISGTAQLISGLTSIGGQIVGNPGIINVTTVGNIRRTAGTGTAKFYFELYKRTVGGVETLLGVSDFTLPVDFNTYSEFSATAVWNDGVFIDTDRIVIKFYGSRIAGGGDPTFDFQFGGLTPVRTIVPVPFSVVASEYELKANKQNSLAVDGTNTKYPTVTAVNTGLALKANLADIETVTQVIGGQNTRIAYKVGENATRGFPLLVYFHGTGENQDTPFTNVNQKKITDQFLQAGYMVATTNGAGNSWGNQASIDSYNALINHLKSYFLITKVVFIGHSMGGIVSLNLMAQGLNTPDAWYGIFPATNLSWCYNNGYSTEIEAAYSFSGIGNYATATAGFDPQIKLESAFPKIKYRFVASASDTAINFTQNSILFNAKINPISLTSRVVEGIGNHGSEGHFILDDALLFSSNQFVEFESAKTLPLSTSNVGIATTKFVMDNLTNYSAPIINSANYIRNQNSSAQSANMWISGNGTFQGSFKILTDSPTFYFYDTYNQADVRNWAISTTRTSFGGMDIMVSNAKGGDPISDGFSAVKIKNTGAATFASSVTATEYKISALNTAPASATATGTTGEIRITAGFIYVCTATNTWVRTALATW